MPSSLYISVDDHRELALEPFEYEPLDYEKQEQRFLILHPCEGDKSLEENHVKCSIEVGPLPTAKPFIAVKNSRAYRLLQGAIEIDGKGLLVPASLERFLRYYRRDSEPVRLWIRHICLLEFLKDEQQKYWKRPFINSMYERATEVVDMAEFNSDLFRRGVVERILDSRYSSWTKQWSGRPDVLALPRVFPIRLGKALSNESPVDHYEYVPLDEISDEMRVMVVMEASDESEPVVVHIGHSPIHCEVTYLCLSYTWGDIEPTAEIILNGQRMRVRKNVEMALRKLRGPDAKLCIWIDAVCIDQLNLAERNRQLTRMSEIYDQAIGVLCYVGDSDEHSDLALDFVSKLQGPMMRFNDEGFWDIGDEGGKIGPDQYPKLCAALYRFLTRSYFKRVWVLQEVAVASNPMIACGGRFDVSLERLETAAFHLQDMIHTDPRLAGQIMTVDPELQTVGEEELSYIRKLSYFRHLESGGQSGFTMGFQYAKIGENAPGFLETAILTRAFQSTDGHDKIFALWNLAKDKEGLDFNMDYSKSVPTSFTEFAVAWIHQHGSLDIIAASESVPASRSFYSNAPSWCPDWTIPATASCLLRREVIPKRLMMMINDLDGVLYAADGGMKQNKADGGPFFTFDGQMLHCTGVILDHITDLLGDVPEFPPPDMRFPMGDPQTYLTYVTWMKTMEDFYTDNDNSPYDDPMQAVTAMFHGDVPSAWPRREDNPDNCSESHPNEKYVCRPELSRHIKYYAGSYNRLEARDAVKMIFRGRTLCVTEKGYMALAPNYVKNNVSEKPWALAILATCSVPVLLQENDDGTYKFCGSAFVQGWMEGEIFKDEMGVDTPQEFWSVMEGSEKIRIV